MSVQLGAFWQSPAPEPQPDPADTALEQVLLAVQALREALLSLPAPGVHVAPQDLGDIVMAVQGLNGPAGPSAEDIAIAVRDVLIPAMPTPSVDVVSPALVKALEQLDFRMKGIGAGGVGGTVGTISNDVAVKPAAGTTAFPVAVQSGVITANTNWDGRTLTERMFAKAAATGYDMWIDTNDASFDYLLEAPAAATISQTGFRGIRVPKSGTGFSGKCQENTAGTLTFTNRTTDGGWS